MHLDSRISYGNILQTVVLVVAIILAYGRMEANQEIISRRGRSAH